MNDKEMINEIKQDIKMHEEKHKQIEKMATIPNWSNHGFVQQGWQCPKCGTILSPSTSFCPFCSRNTWTPTITCGYSGEFVNPNVSTSISKNETKE